MTVRVMGRVADRSLSRQQKEFPKRLRACFRSAGDTSKYLLLCDGIVLRTSRLQRTMAYRSRLFSDPVLQVVIVHVFEVGMPRGVMYTIAGIPVEERDQMVSLLNQWAAEGRLTLVLPF